MREIIRKEHFTIGSTNRIVKYLFIISLLSLLIIPASLGTSVKSIFIVSLFSLCCMCGVKAKEFLIFILITIFNLFYLIYSIYKIDVIDGLSIRAFLSYQGIALTTFALIWGAYSIKGDKIFRLFIIGMSLYCFIKLIFIFMPDLCALTDIDSAFAVDLRTQDFLRIATSNDLLFPFAIFLLLNKCFFDINLSPCKSLLIFIVLLITSILTFTRFVWISTFFAILGYIILCSGFKKLNLQKYKLYIFILFLFFIFTFVSSYISSYRENFLDLIFIRFSDFYSLQIKGEQAGYLITKFIDKPLFGAGNSAFINDYIRYERLPFVYETQWIALLYQFGIIGTTIIAVFLLLPIYPIFKYIATYLRFPKCLFVFFSLYLLFLLSGFTNPNLFTMNSSVVYFMAYAFSSFYLNKKEGGPNN